LKNTCLFLVLLVSQASGQNLTKGNQREEKVYDHIYYVDKEVWGVYGKKKEKDKKVLIPLLLVGSHGSSMPCLDT